MLPRGFLLFPAVKRDRLTVLGTATLAVSQEILVPLPLKKEQSRRSAMTAPSALPRVRSIAQEIAP